MTLRTLVIDNDDSFTYNLVHLLEQVNGCEPLVIGHDVAGFHPALLDEVDNIVISPGPGTVLRSTDIGAGALALDQAEVPVLGVCLGMQAIGAHYGGQITPAPQPRHGIVEPIGHTGHPMFAQVANPFEATRYHSLCVTALPDELEATAFSSDGVLQALAHRSKLQWGVQFHPESITSPMGRELIENFAAATRQWHASRRRPLVGLPTPALAPRQRPEATALVVETLPWTGDAAALFQAVCGEQEGAIWLDAHDDSRTEGRFSILGIAERLLHSDVAAGTVTLIEQGHETTRRQGVFDALAADLAGRSVPVQQLPFAFRPGWVGYLGYELKAECGAAAGPAAPTPDAYLGFLRQAVVLDHIQRTATLVALGHLDDAFRARVVAALELPPLPLPPAQPGSLRPRHSRTAYTGAIDEIQELIRQGETYEACLTNQLLAEPLDSWPAYQRLRAANPTPFGAYLRFPGVAVLSTSPERFLSIDATGRAESRPIKGTRPRGSTPEQDQGLAHDLATSIKDRAENLMIVDLVRHDLGRTAEPGSVQVEALFDVESYATVHQLVSTVSSQLRADTSPIDCVRACFPPGSMTGAPKLRTMAILDELERSPRGVYSGAVGYFGVDGSVDLSVVIRTAVITDEATSYGVGGAIIALSEAADEYEETRTKAAPLLRLLGADFPEGQA